jgi:VRR-NUC domain
MPPLLALAEGRKVRPRKERIPAPKEIALHMCVAKLLKDHCLPEWEWGHIPNGEQRDIRAASKLKAMGVRKGWPDFIFITPYGSVMFLELKREGGSLSGEQDEFRLRCIKRRIPFVVASTIDQVLTTFEEWGCLRVSYAGRA